MKTIGAVETTSSAASSAFVHLARNPELRRRLIDHPELIPGAGAAPDPGPTTAQRR